MRSAVRLLAALLVIAATAGCAGAGDDAPDDAHSASAGPASSPRPHDPAYVTARVRLGGKPCGILTTPTRVWVSNYLDSTVQWIDRRTGRASRPVTVGDQPCGLAFGAGSVWVENYGGHSVTRLDAATGRRQATVAVGVQPYDVAFAAGAAWVTDYADGTVSRVDAATNRRTVVRTGGTPAGIAPVAGGLWVPLADRGVVVRIDARTARVTDRLPTGAGATWTAYTGTDLWVSNGADGTVTHVDAVRRRVVRTVRVGGTPLDGVVAAGAVWVPSSDRRVYRIDPRSDRVTGHVNSATGKPFVISGDDRDLWVADFVGTDAVRLDIAALPLGE